jgi:hypothetical protein
VPFGRPLFCIVLLLALSACGPSRSEWEAKQREVVDLQAQLQQRDWTIQADQQRVQQLLASLDRAQRALSDLSSQCEAQSAVLESALAQLRTAMEAAEREAAQQAAYPTALLEGVQPLEPVELREVPRPPLTLRSVTLEWHFRSSRGGDATVGFDSTVRGDLSEYCSFCTVFVRADCTVDDVVLSDMRAISETEYVMDMGEGDTAQMSCNIFRNTPVDTHPSRCQLVFSLAEQSAAESGVLLGRWCWTDEGRIREGHCSGR